MIFISYDEIDPGHNFPKMKSALLDGKYENKDLIVNFLNNGIIDLAQLSREKDVFTGQVIPDEVLVMHDPDGKYEWSNLLAYYVDKYNLRLPKEFEAYILGEKGG